jgi:hypothetical protein
MARITIDDLTPAHNLNADELRNTLGGHAGHGGPLPTTPLHRPGLRKKAKKKVRRR